ncbi:MAG: ABC transporter ATP-binding protein [Candidatus Buchananbacteria bacterium]
MKDNTKKTLKIFWQFSLKYKVSGIFIVISVFIASALNVVVPLYFKNFFDALASGGSVDKITTILISTLLMIGFLELIQWVFWRISTLLSNHMQSRVMTDLANYCFAYLHRHSFAFFNDNFTGSLVKKVKWFSKAYEAIVDRFTWNLLTLVVNIGAIIIVLAQRNIYLSLGIFIWVAVFLGVNGFFTKYKLKYDILRSEAETVTTGYLADTITNNTTVKLFNGYQRELKGFEQVSDKLRRLRKFTWDLDSVFEAIQGGLMIGLEIGIFYLAIKLWQKGVLTIGDFVLVQTYLVNIINRVWDFGKVIRQIYEHLADAEEMIIILNTPLEIKDVLNAKKLIVKTGEVEFRNVSFYYHETRKVLEDFNLKIKPSEHIALIGPSGAGKSTVVRLLLRMHNLVSGQVLIDNQDIAKVTQESLWQNVSLVPQDPILFHRTLKENIRYGKPHATDAQVYAAAKAAHCHEFIIKFPDGYDTYVGERGVKLSGGERQRVAIARAILRNCPILVLDEATSSLDSESELLIQDALDKLMAGKTVIVIAHRLSTIRKMDRIIVVDQGGIIEEGTHDELLSQHSGLYRRLWQLQAGGFIKY